MILGYRTALLICTFIGAFLFLEDTDRSAEWQTSLELIHAQQEEQAKKVRNAVALEICGPGAGSDWEDSTLTCTPKRGKPYQVAVE